MFQYAFAKSISFQKKDSNIKLDLSWFDTNSLDTKRDFSLDIFNLDYGIANHDEIKKLKNNNALFYRLLRKISKNRMGYNKSHITELNFDLKKCLKIKNLYIDGYWQNERYFSLIKEKL
ncbi:MAG TPA: hypothetical protein PK771_05380 [Spirochaetota bacterium]|nr:hypothetical protein [Spirochaetota bacterium]